MNPLSTGIDAFVRCGAARVPADTLAIELCLAALPVAPPLDLYLATDGGRAGDVEIIGIRRLVLAQQEPTLVPRRPGGLLFAEASDDTVFCWQPDGIYRTHPDHPSTWVRVAADVPHFLDLCLAGELKWPASDRPSGPHRSLQVPNQHGARIAERLAMSMRFIPSAPALIRYCVRRAASMGGQARFDVLRRMCNHLFEELPSAYSRDIVDHVMDAVMEQLVEPVVREVRSEELVKAALIGSLGDLGDHFCDATEAHLAAFVAQYMALLDLRDSPAPPDPVELHIRLRRLDTAINNITTDADRLLKTIHHTPIRDGALNNIGFGWLVDQA